MKNVISVFIFILVVIIFLNLPFICMVMDTITHQDVYSYCTADGYCTQSHTALPDSPGYPNYNVLHTIIVDGDNRELGKQLQKLYPNADTVLYRIFKPNFLVFWHWREYIMGSKKYDFPYKSWDEIKKHRPQNFILNERWQMF